MTEKMQNKIKDININLINNYNSEITKNQIPLRNINSNLNTNSYSQENIFNELINSMNYQESKNNSSFSLNIYYLYLYLTFLHLIFGLCY